MKTIKSSLFLALLTILFSLVLNGCYTQLAFVDDEQYASVEPAPIIIIVPIDHPTPPPIIDPVWPTSPKPIDPAFPPTIHQLPTAGISPVVSEPPSPPRRGSGYQRPGQSESTPISTVSNPDKRPSDPGCGGR